MASSGQADLEKGGTSASLSDSLVVKVQTLDLPEPVGPRVAGPVLMAHDKQADMGRPGLNHIFKGVTESVLVTSPPPLPQPKTHRRLTSMELTH
jgi:hypothetical protein